jgi:hypothetical protein
MTQQYSVYAADCLCGRYFETPRRKFVCPECKRHIVLEWGQECNSDHDDTETHEDLPEVKK